MRTFYFKKVSRSNQGGRVPFLYFIPSDGFTLIEVLVVIVVVLILLGISIPVGKTTMEKARIHQAQADIVKIEGAVEGFKSQNGSYPGDASNTIDATLMSDLDDFMKFPADQVVSNEFVDPWMVPYKYQEPGVNQSGFVDIASAGPDRSFEATWTSSSGTNADNITNWSQSR